MLGRNLVLSCKESRREGLMHTLVCVEVGQVLQQLLLVACQDLDDGFGLVWICHKHLQSKQGQELIRPSCKSPQAVVRVCRIQAPRRYANAL